MSLLRMKKEGLTIMNVNILIIISQLIFISKTVTKKRIKHFVLINLCESLSDFPAFALHCL